MFMPNKPDKYGIKLICLKDAISGYCYIYCDRGSDGKGLTEEEQNPTI